MLVRSPRATAIVDRFTSSGVSVHCATAAAAATITGGITDVVANASSAFNRWWMSAGSGVNLS